MVNISKDAIQVWRLTLQIDKLFDIMESKKLHWHDIKGLLTNPAISNVYGPKLVLEEIENICNILYTTPEFKLHVLCTSPELKLISDHFNNNINDVKVMCSGIENLIFSINILSLLKVLWWRNISWITKF